MISGGGRPPIPFIEPVVRVRIERVRDNHSPLALGSDGEWLEVRSHPTSSDDTRNRDDGGSPAIPSLLRGPIVVSVGRAGWSVIDSNGYRAGVQGFDDLTIEPLVWNDHAAIAVNGHPYPGTIRLVWRNDLAPLPENLVAVSETTGSARAHSPAYDVINYVGVESYLPGVLSRELYRHWDLETHAAQAVAARSFACTEHAFFHDRRHFDLSDNQSSQAYIGAAAHQRAVEATQLTAGLVLAWDNALVPGYYSSCCGGVAADAVDAIGMHPYNDIPPLRGRIDNDVCTDAPRYAWSIERENDSVTRRLAAFGRGCGCGISLPPDPRAIHTIEVGDTNAVGRPRIYTVTLESGDEVSMTAERLRAAMNHDAGETPASGRPLYSSNIRADIQGGTIRFQGRGYGHGAGLCQYGAQALARDGVNHRAILDWYYPEAEIVQAYLHA